MRDTNPQTAPLVPVITELAWTENLPKDEFEVKFVAWDRKSDTLLTYEGRLTEVTLRKGPLDHDAIDWLERIGARPKTA